MSGLLKRFSPVAAFDPLPPDAAYRPLPTLPFDAIKASDEAAKPQVMRRQEDLKSGSNP